MMATDDNFFGQLNTKVVSDAPATDIQAQSDPVHLQKSNKEVLSAIKLVNDATLRSDGGPIPGTQTVYAGPTVTDNTRTVAFTPNPGEVWQVMDITATRTNITGSSGIYLYFNDLETSELILVFYGASTSTEFMLTDDATWDPMPVYISYPCQLQFSAGDAANWDDCKLQLHMVRLR